MGQAAAFLDRDGVINLDHGCVPRLPAALDALSVPRVA